MSVGRERRLALAADPRDFLARTWPGPDAETARLLDIATTDAAIICQERLARQVADRLARCRDLAGDGDG